MKEQILYQREYSLLYDVNSGNHNDDGAMGRQVCMNTRSRHDLGIGSIFSNQGQLVL